METNSIKESNSLTLTTIDVINSFSANSVSSISSSSSESSNSNITTEIDENLQSSSEITGLATTLDNCYSIDLFNLNQYPSSHSLLDSLSATDLADLSEDLKDFDSFTNLNGLRHDVSVGTDFSINRDLNYKKDFEFLIEPINKSPITNSHYQKTITCSSVMVQQNQSESFGQTHVNMNMNSSSLQYDNNYYFNNNDNNSSYLINNNKQSNNNNSQTCLSLINNNRNKNESESFKLIEKIQPKKSRTKYTKEQIEILESAYWTNPYPDLITVEHLCKSLGISREKINIWFQNRRARSKRTGTTNNVLVKLS